MLEFFLQIVRNDRLRFARIPNQTDELRTLLALYDIRLLHNTAQALPDHPHLWLAGVDDPIEGTPSLTQALAGVPAGVDLILLTHNPDLAYAAPAAGCL